MADLNARIKPKKSSTAGEVPLAADLEVAELAVNTADGKIFTKHTDDSIKEISGGSGEGGGGETLPSVNGWTIDSSSNAATTKVLNTPSHNAGDLMVACIMTRNSGGTLTPPGGFVLYGTYLSSLAFSGDVQTIKVFTKVATSSEPATYTWSLASSARICGWVASISGNPTIDSVTENYGNSTTATISTSAGRLNLTAATWVYADPSGTEAYSQSGAGLTEITDSPFGQARISGGYTTESGTITSTHDDATTGGDPNHGMIRIALSATTSINDLDDVDTATNPPVDGDILQWDDAGQKFKPAQLPAGGGAVDSVNGQTGVVSLGIQDQDDFALNPAANFVAFRWAVVSTTSGGSNYDQPGEAAIYYGGGGERCIVNHTDSDGSDVQAATEAAIAANGGSNYNIAFYASRDGGLNWTTHVVSEAYADYGGAVFFKTVSPELDSTTDELRLSFDDPAQPPIPLADGDILQWNDGDQKFRPAQLPAGGGGSRTTVSVTTSSLASAASEDVTLTGTGKAGQFLSVTTDRPAWIVFYADEASRTSDSSRLETDSPSPGSGVLMEIITTTGETIIVSPSVSYFSNETPPVASLPLKVTNKDASTQTVQVDVKLVPSES